LRRAFPNAENGVRSRTPAPANAEELIIEI
jgi:hypothetical protein